MMVGDLGFEPRYSPYLKEMPNALRGLIGSLASNPD
jgi:hypothetical protein